MMILITVSSNLNHKIKTTNAVIILEGDGVVGIKRYVSSIAPQLPVKIDGSESRKSNFFRHV